MSQSPLERWEENNPRYTKEYWAKRRHRDTPWQTELAEILVSEYKIKSIVDFGCGFGAYIEKMYKMGVKVKGYEYNLESVQEEINPEILPFIEKADVTDPIDCGNFDCSLSIEVGEHLAPDHEKNTQYINNLINASQGYIFFTAAPPEQKSPKHINCQPKQYWIDLFEANGARYDGGETNRLQNLWALTRCKDYILTNLMIFSKLEKVNEMNDFDKYSVSARSAIGSTHRKLIFDILMAGNFKNVMEIGCLRGFSSCAFLEALNQGCDFNYTICDPKPRRDIHKLLEQFGQGKNIQLIEKPSLEVIAPGYDFIFIDGEHRIDYIPKELMLLMDVGAETMLAHDTFIQNEKYAGPPLYRYVFSNHRDFYYVDDSKVRPEMGKETYGVSFFTKHKELFDKVKPIFEAIA